MHQMQLFNAKNLPSIHILSLIDLACYSLPDHTALSPLAELTVNLLLRFLLNKVILLHLGLELAFKNPFLIQILRSVARINLIESLRCAVSDYFRCLMLGCRSLATRTLHIQLQEVLRNL